MLELHLSYDHHEVEVDWIYGEDDTWKLKLTIPEPEEESDESSLESSRSPSPEPAPPPEEAFVPGISDSIPQPDIPAPLTIRVKTEDGPSVPRLAFNLSALKAEEPDTSLLPLRAPTASPPSLRERTPVIRIERVSPTPRPPPVYRPVIPDPPLGPTARYPYLPPQTADGKPCYSCRPGGPRLYDLLYELPLEEFGALAWQIVDKEEELFELDDVRDEDKVIQALWNRWIFLNHGKFLVNYYQGVLAFVDKYDWMIQKAAGWVALRTWLLVRLLPVENVKPCADVS
ncbi:hypothetical protein BV25DRAFT_1822674 [Artomyces pyxidatus]|uniref:Uncharacterized protein n=1 Tax=Artomyces pyxidatus TaxID=48021 RepID=A0ACB8T9R0_9AGAM|nr:hypothetical protein BV25DRAFT_1822674 [Artomyces pyxidatus]